MIYEWNITKCRAKYKGHKEANYTFWIVDYFKEEEISKKINAEIDNEILTNNPFKFFDYHMTDLRDKKLFEMRFFKSEKEVTDFIKGLNKEGGESYGEEREKTVSSRTKKEKS